MIASQPCIIYVLPKSRTTQALNGKRVEKAWHNIKVFLDNCTNANIEAPNSIKLTAFSASIEFGEALESVDKILEETQKVFRHGEKSPIAYQYPSGKPSEQYKIEWKLQKSDLSKAINYIIQGQPWPKYHMGPVELIISYYFKLIDPVSKVELPNQEFESSILIWLSRSNSISPTFWFPFAKPDNNFWNYVDSIQKLMPFKFEQKYLRSVSSNKKGTANVFSKL